MPDTQISEEMVERARFALHNLVGLTRLDISAAEINEAVRAVLRATLSGYVVVPRNELEFALQLLREHNDCGPPGEGWQSDTLVATCDEFQRAMIQAAPPVQEMERG